MRARFWHERWQQNQIGFHQQNINTHLQQFWGHLQAPAGSTVFVPLCGKSRDMLWLRAEGYKVLGIELSPVAVRDFFAENGLIATVSQQGAFERWEADGLVILLGDFFQLTATDLAECAAVFDRASLIALPPDMRVQYAGHFLQIVPAHSPTLLITIEYEQALAGGPPFSVTEQEVRDYYSAHFTVKHLLTIDASADLPGLCSKGVPVINEHVYVLTVS